MRNTSGPIAASSPAGSEEGAASLFLLFPDEAKPEAEIPEIELVPCPFIPALSLDLGSGVLALELELVAEEALPKNDVKLFCLSLSPEPDLGGMLAIRKVERLLCDENEVLR